MINFMKKILFISVLSLITTSLFMACDSDDPEVTPPSKGAEQIEQVIKELEKNSEVKEFTSALKSAASSLNVEEEKLTVLAAKNFNPLKSTAENISPGITTLKRHIVKGAYNFSAMTTNEMELKSIANDVLYVTKENGKTLVNGIPVSSTSPTKAGDSYIYVVDETIPDAKDIPETKNKIAIKVLECNEAWSEQNNVESTVSNQVTITFYEKKGDKYNEISSIESDEKGEVVFNHNYSDNLYYNVKKEGKKTSYSDYLPVGVFTSQNQIDSYPEYRTGSILDMVSPGSIKLADINGDGIIDEQDKVSSEYFSVEINDEQTVYLVSPEPLYENIIGLEDLPKINNSLNETFLSFLEYNYRMDYDLTKPNVQYPNLPEYFYRSLLWESAYKYINNYLSIVDVIEQPNYPKYIVQEWNKTSGKHWDQFAYVYSVLVSYYGDVPLITEKIKDISEANNIHRSPKKDVIEFIQTLSDKTSSKFTIDAILARYYANEKDFAKAYSYSKGIVDSNRYTLYPADKVFDDESNSEVIMGGYQFSTNLSFVKGNYMHPLRYTETVLTLAQAAIETGKLTEGMQYLDLYYTSQNLPVFSGEMTYQRLKDLIISASKDALNNEGINFMLINRWDALLQELGSHGAQAYNYLLPIPNTEINLNPNITQNPGY